MEKSTTQKNLLLLSIFTFLKEVKIWVSKNYMLTLKTFFCKLLHFETSMYIICMLYMFAMLDLYDRENQKKNT